RIQASVLPLFPNPATDRFTVQFDLPEDSDAAIQCYAPTGQMLYSQTASYAAGLNSVSINVSEMHYTGLLFVKVEMAGGRFVQTVVVK
ncbi:MAG: T9SS type A sorting domain-containing protein, partial [Saprospiraceae bacterium]|nr:T9SS type A sorting domain-containing protein [Saprospiraceae bacterium]